MFFVNYVNSRFGGGEVTVQEESRASQCSGSVHNLPVLQERGPDPGGKLGGLLSWFSLCFVSSWCRTVGSPGVPRLLLKSFLMSLQLQNWVEDTHLCRLFIFTQAPNRQLSLSLALAVCFSGRLSAVQNFHSDKKVVHAPGTPLFL